MKLQIKNNPFARRQEKEATLAANRMNSLFRAKTGFCVSSVSDAPRTPSSQSPGNDANIRTAVKDAIAYSTTAPEGVLEIGVKNGWVTLRGSLDSWALWETVERVVLHTIGVRGVTNLIRVGVKPVSYENQ